jgi:hypothetical protein
MDKEWHCGCGIFKTDWPAAKALHQLRCDGTPKAREGRIAARAGSVASSAPAAAAAAPARSAKRHYKKRKATKRTKRVARVARRLSKKAAGGVRATGTCETCVHHDVCALRQSLEGARLKILSGVESEFTRAIGKGKAEALVAISCSLYAAAVPE